MDNLNKRAVVGLIMAFIISLSLIGVLYSQLQETRRQANQQIMEISKRADTARAGELAGQSQLLDMDNGTKMIQSGLLAVESAKYGANLQADQALRRYLYLAALPIAKVSHGDNVNTVYMAYSRDGKYIASGGGTIVKVWEAQSGREVARMFTDFTVYSLAFSQDGNYVAAGNCSYERAVQVWEVKSGKAIITQPSQTGCPVVSFSPNGKYIAWEEGSLIRVWDVKSKSEVYYINCEGSVTDITFSPNGQYLLSSNCNTGAQVFDAKNGREIIRLSQDSIIDKTIFSSDSKYIATISDSIAAVWEASSGREVSQMYHDKDVNDVAFSPDGRFVVSGSMDGTARVWYASNGDEVARMTHETSVNSAAFSPDGKYIVSGSYDGTARIWTLGGYEVARFADASITSVAFSPDGKYIATGGCESLTYYQNGQPSICQGVARVWEVSNGSYVLDIQQSNHGGINSIMYSPLNDKYVLTGSRDGTARIWDVQSGREIIHIALGGEVYAVFSPDGKYILTRSTADKTARVWDSKSGLQISCMDHIDTTAMDFSPDSQYVASGSVDGVIIVWEVKTGHEVAHIVQDGTIQDINGITRNFIFSPDGKYLAFIESIRTQNIVLPITEETVRIWDVFGGHEITHITYPSWVTAIAFSPDSKHIVLAGTTDPLKKNFNGIVSIRETLTGNEIASFMHPSHILSMIFTSDGKHLVTGSADGLGTIVVWDMQAGKESARILSGDPLYGSNSLSLSSDNRYLLAGGYSIHIWDLQSDRPQVEVRDELTNNITFITHSRYLQSKNEISEFSFSNSGSSQFSPDGRYILTTGCDFNHYGVCNEQHIFILYWRVEDLAAEACRRLPRNFTQAEWVQYFPNEDYSATCPNLPIEP
jgi:WD40 repeat protein